MLIFLFSFVSSLPPIMTTFKTFGFLIDNDSFSSNFLSFLVFFLTTFGFILSFYMCFINCRAPEKPANDFLELGIMGFFFVEKFPLILANSSFIP